MKVIGVVGHNGSGKDEVVKYLHSRRGVPFLSSGDIVREIASKEGLEPTRANLQEISDRYFRKFGKGYFIKLVADQIHKNGWEVAGISGIRSLDDVVVAKDAFGEGFTLVHVYVSDPRTRYTRMHKRGEGRDPYTYEEFLRQDEAEEKIFHTKEASQHADYSLSNDGTLDDLRRAIDRLIDEEGLLLA